MRILIIAVLCSISTLAAAGESDRDQLCLKQLQGRWQVVSSISNGDEYDREWVKSLDSTATVTGRQIITRTKDELAQESKILSATAEGDTCLIRQLVINSIYDEGKTTVTRVRFAGDQRMQALFGKPGAETLPFTFAAPKDSGFTLFGYQRNR